MITHDSGAGASAGTQPPSASGGEGSDDAPYGVLDPGPGGIDEPGSGTVSIAGNAIQGSTLTASITIADADGLGDITYQWFADGDAVGSGSTLTLEQRHVGKLITVTASFLNRAGEATSVESSATRPVVDINLAPVLNDPGPVSIATDQTGDPVPVAGSLSVDDPDGDIVEFSVERGTIDNNSAVITRIGLYGTLELDSRTGAFAYMADADKLLAATRSPVDLFIVSVTDDEFTDTAILEIGTFEAFAVEVLDPDGDGWLWNAQLSATTGGVASAEDLQLYRTYSGILGRAPDPGGFAFYRESIATGELDLPAMTNDFLWSEEFLSFFPGANRPSDISSADFVNYLYLNLFGRESDDSGFAYWTSELDSGNRDFADVAISMAQSNEFVALTAVEAVDFLIG